jgi:hypothetical protein
MLKTPGGDVKILACVDYRYDVSILVDYNVGSLCITHARRHLKIDLPQGHRLDETGSKAGGVGDGLRGNKRSCAIPGSAGR